MPIDKYSKFFDFFDKIYCINLDARPDRWEETQLELSRFGLKGVERFSAVKNPESPEQGCADSHRTLIMQAKDQGLRKILIFEDDIEFLDKDDIAFAKVENFVKNNRDWTLFYLGGRAVRSTKLVSENVLKGAFLSTHAYAVNLDNYDFHTEIELPIDSFYAKHYSQSYILYPMIAGQRESFSDITQNTVEWKTGDFEESLVWSRSLPTVFLKAFPFIRRRRSMKALIKSIFLKN